MNSSVLSWRVIGRRELTMRLRGEPSSAVLSPANRSCYRLALLATALSLTVAVPLWMLNRVDVVHSPMPVQAVPARIDLLQSQQASPDTRRRLPHCIIIGAKKTGTRALIEYLALHPSIVAARKEVFFFDKQVHRGLDWYLTKMPLSTPSQITIEKTPTYFTASGVPERVLAMNASILLILIVRDPIERAISDYVDDLTHVSDSVKQMRTFEYMALDAAGWLKLSYRPIRTSMYAEHLARWLRVFPHRQVHIVDGDRLAKEPLPELNAVERFLGIENRLSDRHLYFNATRGFYCMRTETGKEKCLGKEKGRPHPSVPPEVIAKMARFFAPHNERFFQLVGRRFDW